MASASIPSAADQLKALVQVASERLLAAGVDSPRLDAELLLAFATGLIRERLLTDSIIIDQTSRERYAAMIEQRAARMPLAYIVGTREFYSLRLEVSLEVLIPRPETETLVTAALAYIDERSVWVPRFKVFDLGTGSGAIALAIAANAPRTRIVASDISPAALALAARNAERLGLASQVEFRRADCWDVTDDGAPLGRFDLVVSNPPYISETEIDSLPAEIRDFEPRVALAGGPDGLAFYRRIAVDSGRHLTWGGALMVEVGHGQATEVAAIFRDAGFDEITLFDDLAGIRRVVVARPPAR
jgi:release factor glutamine methyltransferase